MSTENDTEPAAPRTAADLIQEAARVVNWTPDDKHPMQARYDAARAMASMYAYWTIVSLETLRRINPALAEAVTTHIDNDLDWPNAHEHAYGWEQTLAAGKPIPADAWPFWEISGQPAGEPHPGTHNLAEQGNPGDSPISAELGETGYKAIAAEYGTRTETVEDLMRRDARNVLEAAYPAIRQQVAEQIAAALDERHRSNLALSGGDEGIVPRDGRVALATGYQRAAQIAREIGSKS